MAADNDVNAADDHDADDNDIDKSVAPGDVDFFVAMQQLLGFDKAKATELIDKLDADAMQALQDAIARNDKEAAQDALGQSETDETVNALFRGKNLKVTNSAHKAKTRRNVDGKMQFAIGDDVMVSQRDHTGKVHKDSATVERTDGPEGSDTLIVRIKGKSTVVDKRDVEQLDEGVLGMVGVPNLQRMQQLAGIPTAEPAFEDPMEPQTHGMMRIQMGSLEPDSEPPAAIDDTQCPLDQVLTALEALETFLPSVRLADLKDVRARIGALQMSLNEQKRIVSPYGRTRKR